MSRYRVMTYLLLLKQNEYSSDVQLYWIFCTSSVESFAPCDILKIYSFNKYLLINSYLCEFSPPMNQLFAPSSIFFVSCGCQVTTFWMSFHLPRHSFYVSRLLLFSATTVRLLRCLVTFSQGNFYPKPFFMTINTIYKLMTSRFFFLASLLSWALD